jgi:hypothetical protein
VWAFALLLLVVLLAVDVSLMLMLLGLVYVLSGVFITWRGRRRRRGERTHAG